MASLQAPGGSSKAAKFQAVNPQAGNPLAPMLDPFSGLVSGCATALPDTLVFLSSTPVCVRLV